MQLQRDLPCSSGSTTQPLRRAQAFGNGQAQRRRCTVLGPRNAVVSISSGAGTTHAAWCAEAPRPTQHRDAPWVHQQLQLPSTSRHRRHHQVFHWTRCSIHGESRDLQLSSSSDPPVAGSSSSSSSSSNGSFAHQPSVGSTHSSPDAGSSHAAAASTSSGDNGSGAAARPAHAGRAAASSSAGAGAQAPAGAGPGGSVPDLATLDDKQLQLLAWDWGYTQVGRPLPEGLSAAAIAETLPDEDFAPNSLAAAGRFALSLGVMAAAYAWLWHMRGVCPLWQRALCWLVAGTGYFGVFATAVEAARSALFPVQLALQDVVGAALLAPALWSFESFRLQYFNHLMFLNVLDEDTDAWHPLLLSQLAVMPRWRRGLARAFHGSPLKLLGSLGAWLRSWDSLDLQRHPPRTQHRALLGWAAPLAFAALAWPVLLRAGGVAGWASWWLAPWLVFHGWLSFLTLVAHTAPHVRFVRLGPEFDPAQAVVNGSVTLVLPRWLEVLLHDANYHLPQQLSLGVPMERARAAYGHLRERLGPYLTEARFSFKLLVNLLLRWAVYDERRGTYLDFHDALELVEEEEAQRAQAAGAAAGARAADGGREAGGSAAGVGSNWRHAGQGQEREWRWQTGGAQPPAPPAAGSTAAAG